MKKQLFYPVLFLLAGLVACQDKKEIFTLSVNDERAVFLFTDGGGQEIISVNANVTWSVAVEGDNPWCQANKRNKAELSLVVEPNITLADREARITLSSRETSPVELTVRQAGAASGIAFAADTCRVIAAGGVLRVAVAASVEYTVVPAATWITHREKEGDEELFDVEENLDKTSRATTVLFHTNGVGESKSLAVVQAGRDPVYVPGDASALSTDFKLSVRSSVASEANTGEGIELSHDGNYSTYYHSRWGEETSYPVTMTYTLDNADRLDYLVYYPRQDGGSNGNFKTLKIHAKTAGSSAYTLLGDHDFGGTSSPTRVVFSPPVVSPSEVRIEVLSGVGDNAKGFVSCAEMEFYKRAEAPAGTDLFVDPSCSELKPGVTLEQVREIPDPFIRGMASYIFHGDYPIADRVREYPAYPRPETVARANKMKKYGLLDNATGISVSMNEVIVLFAGSLHGRDVSLRIMDFNEGYAGISYPVSEGMNYIKAACKGLAYVVYHTDDAGAPPVKIHVASGQVNGLFDLSRHGKSDWQPILSRAVNQHIDVLGSKVHLLFPVARYRAHCPDIVPLLEAYDNFVRLEQEFTGLEKYNRVPPNRVMLLVSYNPNTYMSATDYRTNYNDNTLWELLDVNRLVTTAIWGPVHEIGHVHQTPPTLSWVGLGEVSNNIYSLYVQTSYGNTSRLTAESGYRRGFNDIVVAGIPHAHMGQVSSDPYFQKLVPFWQLHLYALTLGKPDLYKDLHEMARVGTDKNYSTQSGEIQLDFARNVCDLLERDLTGFFESWGFLREIDEEVGDYSKARMTITARQIYDWKAGIAAKSYAKAPGGLVYLSDNTVDVIKERREIVKGTFSRSGTSVTTTNWKNVMAFEVYHDGVLTYATPDASFTFTDRPGTVAVKAVAWDGTRVNAE
ncbi:MAG: M60 family metallopeptidase [Odoribacteraceae bacterium]|jgi:hypothetical protein|nr:M60 family metallopeptidase [Odoribacteraceae bacterium]